MEIPTPPDSTLELGPDGFATLLSHPLAPAIGRVNEPARLVALDYLGELARAGYLPITGSDLDYLRRTANGERVDATAEARLSWLPDRQIVRNRAAEATIVFVQQMAGGEHPIPIEGRGVRVVCQHGAKDEVLFVAGASSTLRKHTDLSEPAKKALSRWFDFKRSTAIPFLVTAFGLKEAALENADIRLVAFDPTDDHSLTASPDERRTSSRELAVGLKLESNHPRGGVTTPPFAFSWTSPPARAVRAKCWLRHAPD